MHQALGKLALAGLNSAVRFRLGEDLACEVIGERLFKLACDLGWLNLVDTEAETEEPVYAFFHPTFQEYFAACATADWHEFLNHVPDKPESGTYRVFEPLWKEAILLWLDQRKLLIEYRQVDTCDRCGNLDELRQSAAIKQRRASSTQFLDTARVKAKPRKTSMQLEDPAFLSITYRCGASSQAVPLRSGTGLLVHTPRSLRGTGVYPRTRLLPSITSSG